LPSYTIFDFSRKKKKKKGCLGVWMFKGEAEPNFFLRSTEF
jgi:hypothetical protein